MFNPDRYPSPSKLLEETLDDETKRITLYIYGLGKIVLTASLPDKLTASISR